MEFRPFSARPRALVAALAAGCVVAVVAPGPASGAAPPPPGAWVRPVAGALAAPVRRASEPRYGPGHRGADLVAAPGTPVRAANAGEVTFAGSVAGSLHVVVAHPGGLRTSYSFLAFVAVRRGQQVARGEVVGTAGGGTGDHAGVLHLGLRLGDRYVDPMVLFVPADLTRLIRLVPADEPDQAGFDPPAVERRSLSASLHLSRGTLPAAATEDGSSPSDVLGDVWAGVEAVARTGRGTSARRGRGARPRCDLGVAQLARCTDRRRRDRDRRSGCSRGRAPARTAPRTRATRERWRLRPPRDDGRGDRQQHRSAHRRGAGARHQAARLPHGRGHVVLVRAGWGPVLP